MDSIDKGREDASSEVGLEPGADVAALWRSFIVDEEQARYWSESVWGHGAAEVGVLLFADMGVEADLCNEIRLSELWNLCEIGCLCMDEFFELSALIGEVQGIPGSLCVDCDMLCRPNISANWALAATTLCRSHLRFRLGHLRIDGGTGRR